MRSIAASTSSAGFTFFFFTSSARPRPSKFEYSAKPMLSFLARGGKVSRVASSLSLLMSSSSRANRASEFSAAGVLHGVGRFSGLRHLRYGTGHDDPMPFTLTLTPQYVAREIKKALPVSFLRVQRYAERNADKLRAIAKLERERGLDTHTLE